MRLFYALKVPAEVAEQLAPAQKELRGNWRAVRPEQFHITLAYLPGVNAQDLDHLRAVGREAARAFAPLTLRVRGSGYFPNEGSPRVWFAKVDAPELPELAQALRAALKVEFDDKPFKSHITLARKKGPAPRVSPIVWDLGWEAGAFSLIESTLHKSGPSYDTVSIFKFARSPQEARHG